MKLSIEMQHTVDTIWPSAFFLYNSRKTDVNITGYSKTWR